MREMFQQLWKVLDEFPEHVVIGGIAATLMGSPRTTADVDIVLVLPPREAERVVTSCERHGFRPGPEAAAKLSAGRPTKFAFSRRFSVDIRLASFSLDRAAIQRAQEIPLFRHPLRVATPEDLIVYKLARWNAIDQVDVRHLLQRVGDSLDTAYLEDQIRVLMQEAGLPALMERWRSIKPDHESE